MFDTFASQSTEQIPDNNVLETDLFVYGLATVPEDAVVHLKVTHPNLSQLNISLLPVEGLEESRVTLFNGTTDVVLGETLTLDKTVPHSGNDSVNGKWTLRIEDSESGGSGILSRWSLDLSSRID